MLDKDNIMRIDFTFILFGEMEEEMVTLYNSTVITEKQAREAVNLWPLETDYTITVTKRQFDNVFMVKSSAADVKEEGTKKRYCLVFVYGDEMSKPLFFRTHEEAYRVMENALIEHIIEYDEDDCHKWLTKRNRLKMKNMALAKDEGVFEITEHTMWADFGCLESGLSAEIYEINENEIFING